jgi:hypothetical protein
MPATPFDFFEKNGYENGFCSCHKDPLCCVSALCCTPCLVGKLKGDMDGKDFDIWSCLCFPLGAFRIRRRVQHEYNKTETEDGTMCATGLCLCCAIAQDGHEIRVHQQASQPVATAPAATEAPVA